MKSNKVYFVFFLLLIILIVVALSLNSSKGILKDINYKKYQSLVKEKRNVVYLSGENCEGCKNQEPILKELSSFYNLDIYRLKINELSDSQLNELALSIEKDATTITVPSILILNEGTVMETLVGFQEKDDIVSFLQKNHILEGFISINMDDYVTLTQKKERTTIYVGKDSCDACKEFEPTLKEALKDINQFIYYLNMDKVTDDGKHIFMGSFEELTEGIYTPQILVIEDGKLIHQLIGIKNKEEVLSILKES